MRLSYFIASRIKGGNGFSATAHRIGTATVALGTATMLIFVMIAVGWQQTLRQKLSNFSGHITITSYHVGRSLEEPPMKRHVLRELPEVGKKQIQAIRAFAHKPALLRSNNILEGVRFKGLDPHADYQYFLPYLLAGRMPNFQYKEGEEVLISQKLATKLQLKAGDKVVAYFIQEPPRYRKLHVVGIYTTAIPEIDEHLALCDLRLLQRLNGWEENTIGGYEILLKDSTKTDTVYSLILQTLDTNLQARSVAQEYVEIFDWLVILQQTVIFFIMLVLLVACTNAVAITLITLKERTAMIGILRALGGRKKLIRDIFWWDVLRLLGIGGLWGNAVGFLFGGIQHYSKIIKLPEDYDTPYLVVAWDWRVFLGVNTLSGIVVASVVFWIIHAIMSTKPLKAIRLR